MRTIILSMKTEAFHKNIIKVFLVLLAVLLSSCVNTSISKPKIIVVPNNIGYRMSSVLDIRLATISVSHMRASDVLSLLTKAIVHTPGKRPYFSWGIGTEPSSLKGLTLKEDRWVTINQTNTTLRQVLDELCAQTGWRYEESAIGISFTAPTNWAKK